MTLIQNKNMTNELPSRLHRYISGYRLTQLLYVAAELGIADLLSDGSKSIRDLAEETQSEEESLYRVLRALTTIEVFRETDKGFEQTDLSQLLTKEDPRSLRALAIMRGEEVNWKPWGELLFCVRTGKSPFNKAFNMNLFEYYEAHPKSGQTFNEGMYITTRPDIPAILNTYDFSPFDNIVEVGGGLGHLIFSILKRYKSKKGILYDLPHVCRESQVLREEFDVGDRCRIVGGEFFDSVPEGGDVYVLKRIMHDWSDELCVKILKNCHQAMTADGKLVIFDSMVNDDHSNPEGKEVDVHMMVVCPGGKERTRQQFSDVFQAAGFELGGLFPIRAGLYAIEGIRK